MINPKKVTIPYCPQPYQLEIHQHSSRNKVVVIGRRGGKTETLENHQIRNAYTDPGLHWIIAPTYKQVKMICWRRLKKLLKDDDMWKPNEQELSMTHQRLDTIIELKGADNEDSLKGVGLKSAGLDECAIMRANVWPEIIRPMLADSQGGAMFTGTPKGRNWYYDLYLKGLNGDPNWKSWNYPTSINKYISKDEIEQARKDMSERLFRQEFMAEFIDDETGVFRKIRQCIVGELKSPIKGRFYVMGVDLAKTENFTVLTVLDSVTRELVAFERFREISWTEQKVRIQKLAHEYNNALVLIDSTGVGDPITEDLERANISLYYDKDKPGYKFSNESKVRLIEQLAISIEQRLITFPRIEVLVNELQQFEYAITDQGRIKYGAPEGKYDDCVISLALANWGIRSYIHTAQVITPKEADPIDRQGHGELIGAVEEKSAPSGY